jgi:hypothetical protein
MVPNDFAEFGGITGWSVLWLLVFNCLGHGRTEGLELWRWSSEGGVGKPARERKRDGRGRSCDRFRYRPERNAFAAKSATARIVDFKKSSIRQGRKTAPALNQTWCPETSGPGQGLWVVGAVGGGKAAERCMADGVVQCRIAVSANHARNLGC